MLKTKKQRQIFKRNLIRFVLVLAVLTAVVWFFTPKVISWMGYGPKPFEFMFESSLAPGWKSEGNVNPKETLSKSYSKEEVDGLPVASISVLQEESDQSDGCFINYSYFDFKADTKSLRDNLVKKTTEDKTLQASRLGDYKSKLTTPKGKIDYTLYQYDLKGQEGENMLRGAAFGYVEMKDAYIEIRAYCGESASLEVLSLPLGIEAVKLVENKD